MEARERAICATLAYYGALRWPLTAVELTQRLIPPSRLGSTEPSPKLGAILSLLEQAETDGRVRVDSGLYGIGNAPADIATHRVHREAVSADKWHRMLRAARWLEVVPYVRMLAAGGSLALGSCSAQSDWDVFTIVQARRIYTARLGLLMMAGMMGRLRTKRMRIATDRFCFNHIITTDGLAVRHRSLFTAHALAWLVPFYDPNAYALKLRHANGWVSSFVAQYGECTFERRTVATSRILATVRRTLEAALNSPLGNALEYVARRWMQGRIRREPMTYERGGRIVADDRELEFHPHSFEAVALARYNASLVRLGLGQYSEHDSGLSH